MLYIFTGTDTFEVKLQTQKWKEKFIEKYGDFNLTHIKDFWEINLSFLTEALQSQSLFDSKKLIILEVSSDERKNADTERKKELLLQLLENISWDTIVLISLFSPDKRSSFYKKVTKTAEKIQVFDEKKSWDFLPELYQRYKNIISYDALQLLSQYKNENYVFIVSEIEKLSIFCSKIEVETIKENIIPELDASIFLLVDAILSKNSKELFKLLKIISHNTNIYLLYNSLLSNIRTIYYITLLKEKKKSYSEISSLLQLGKRDFLINKNYKLSNSEIIRIYKSLIVLDRQMKTGKFIGSEEKDFYFELEKTFLTLFKN